MLIILLVLMLGCAAIGCAVWVGAWAMRAATAQPAPATSSARYQAGLATHEIIGEVYAGRLNTRR